MDIHDVERSIRDVGLNVHRDASSLRSRISTCEDCDLCRTRNRSVPGHGPVGARVMFVGEAPGAVEDETGIPFVGRSGALLRKVMSSEGLPPEEVYITNVVKCRPPGNRTPTKGEIDACRPHLMAEMEIIDPGVVVLVGSVSARALLRREVRMEQDTDRIIEWNGRKCILIYHPGWIIRASSARLPVISRQISFVTSILPESPVGLERWR
jgi:DNA polymerase